MPICMVAEMTCYTYLGHIRNPRIYAVPSPQLRGFYAILLSSQKPRKMGEYCIFVTSKSNMVFDE